MAHTEHAAHTVRYTVTLRGSGAKVDILGLDAFHAAQRAGTIARVEAITPIWRRLA